MWNTILGDVRMWIASVNKYIFWVVRTLWKWMTFPFISKFQKNLLFLYLIWYSLYVTEQIFQMGPNYIFPLAFLHLPTPTSIKIVVHDQMLDQVIMCILISNVMLIVAVTLYKCAVERPDCSRCLSNLTTRSELNCGWCSMDDMCTVQGSSQCTGGWVSASTNQNCPSPVLTKVRTQKFVLLVHIVQKQYRQGRYVRS